MPAIPQEPLAVLQEPTDQVYIGDTWLKTLEQVSLAKGSLVIHVHYPSKPSPGAQDFRASWSRNHQLIQTFVLDSYILIENILKPSFRRHPVVSIVLDDHNGLAQTSGGAVTISCVWLDSWHDKLVKAEERGLAALEQERIAYDLEIRGVLLHELVHAIQFDGHHTAPGWFIESLADYIRLRSGLAAANWGPSGSGPDKNGYEQGYGVGAKFLYWIEHGKVDTPASLTPPYTLPKMEVHADLGALRTINCMLETRKWHDRWIVDLAGDSWDKLWMRYKEAYASQGS